MIKQPWFKFYPTDWRSDSALTMCGLAARGLWIEMLAIMHEASPRGHLVLNGKAVTNAQLATLARSSVNEVEKLLDELEQAGVFSRKKNEIIYSRKMERDQEKSRKNRDNGKMGGNPTLSKDEQKNKSVNPQLKAQKPEARSQKPETIFQKEIDNNPPPQLLLGGGGEDLMKKMKGEAEPAFRAGATQFNNLLPIVELLSQGADIDRDIWPIIRDFGARKTGNLASWKPIAMEIKAAMERRAEKPNELPTEINWDTVVANFKRFTASARDRGLSKPPDFAWAKSWGPRPGEAGCQAPIEILNQYGFPHDKDF